MINFCKTHFSGLSRRILSGAAGSFALNIINQAFLLGITVILTRIMAPEDYGLYAVIIAVMMLLALPFAGGFPIFLIRHISAAIATERYDLFRGLIQKSFFWVLGGSLVIAIIASAVLPYIVQDAIPAYQVGLALITVIPLLLFSGSILRGLRHVILGRFPEFFVQPALLLGILALLLMTGTVGLSPQMVLGFHVASYVLAFFVSAFILFLFLPKKVKQAKSSYDTKKWIKSALPLMVAVGLVVVNSNIDIVMVGALAGDIEAGQYRVATRMAGFVLFFLLAANNTVGALISAKHVKGEREELQTLLTSVARITMLGTLPIAVVLWIWPQEILSLFFGAPFIAGGTALIILATANFFSVSMGQVGHVMSMTGQEKYTAYAALIAMVANIVLNLLLIPHYGLNGAAIATGSSIVIWNAILAYWTVKKTGYRCTALGRLV